MISTNQIAYFKCSAVFLKMMKVVYVTFFVSPRACSLLRLIGQKVKVSEIPSVA